MAELQIYCVFSREAIKAMNGNRGKLAAQAGHAYLHAWWSSMFRHPIRAWRYFFSGSAVKTCAVVDTTEQLVALYERHKSSLGSTLVQDAGRTVFGKPTITCIGLGPIPRDQRPDDLKNLDLLI